MSSGWKRLRKRVVVFVVLAVALVAIDQTTKWCALRFLVPGERIPVVPGLLSLQLYRNPGASLGMGSSVTWMIGLLAIVACIVLAILALESTQMAWTVAFCFGFSGALGNLIDRIIFAHGFLNGRVVDFLNYGWSIGNVADIYLTVTAALIVILLIVGVPLEFDWNKRKGGNA